MIDSFTPKQVAVALQVSESSVKRWCDQGGDPHGQNVGRSSQDSVALSFGVLGGYEPQISGSVCDWS